MVLAVRKKSITFSALHLKKAPESPPFFVNMTPPVKLRLKEFDFKENSPRKGTRCAAFKRRHIKP